MIEIKNMRNREEVITSLEYRLIRYPVKRHTHTNDDELNEYIKEIVEKPNNGKIRNNRLITISI